MTPYEFGAHIAGAACEKQAVGPRTLNSLVKFFSGAGATAARAAPAARTAVSSAAPRLRQAYRMYNTASTPLATTVAKRLPQSMRPFATTLAKGTTTGTTAGLAYGAYNDAATATADVAQRAARQTGVTDPAVLQEVGNRARGQLLPIAYRSLAPRWLGGDRSTPGQQLSKDIGTAVYHNIAPVLLQPSPYMASLPPTQRALMATIGNPVSALSAAIFPPRPSAQQMWQNIPAARRTQMVNNMTNAATTARTDTSPLARSMQHIFAPVAEHHARNMTNTLSSYLTR